MSGSGSGGGTTVTETRIPEELKPLAQQQGQLGAQALGRLGNQLLSAGPSELVAGFTPLQQQGFASAQQAIGEGGIIPEVTNQLRGTAGGDFLFGNAGFDEAVQASIRAAQPSILSTFGRGGGTPGGLAQVAMQQAASDSFAGLFNAERARQQQAQLALPQLSLIPSDILSGLGGEQQALAQRQLMAPIQAQQMLLEASGGGVPLSGLLGQAQTAPSGSGRSRLAGGLGGAASGAAMGSMIGPWGTAIGAGVGGLLGAFA